MGGALVRTRGRASMQCLAFQLSQFLCALARGLRRIVLASTSDVCGVSAMRARRLCMVTPGSSTKAPDVLCRRRPLMIFRGLATRGFWYLLRSASRCGDLFRAPRCAACAQCAGEGAHTVAFTEL